jgi:hypothetical protein
MLYPMASIAVIVVMFGMMISMIALGHRIGKNKTAEAGLSLTEGAVFTLMAFLIAFTFSSANQRYDQRRILIVDEANAIGTAYLRLEMLPENDRELLREDFLTYTSSRLAIYQAIPDIKAVIHKLAISKGIQAKLWKDAISACKNSNLPMMPMLILPSINTMFDIANTRTAYSFLHPHFAILSLLLLVAMLSAFLTGYGISGKGSWLSLHVMAFSLISTLTIYIIMDLEYPRLGIITEAAFDVHLEEVKNDMLKARQ